MGVPLSISMKLSKILWDLEATLINKEGLVQTPGQDGCQATSGRAERVEPGGTSCSKVIREPVILKDRGARGSHPKMRR